MSWIDNSIGQEIVRREGIISLRISNVEQMNIECRSKITSAFDIRHSSVDILQLAPHIQSIPQSIAQ